MLQPSTPVLTHAPGAHDVPSTDTKKPLGGSPTSTARAILANVTDNERVVHQLLMQQGSLAATLHQDLDELACADPQVALQLAVHGQATKAYWNLVVDSLTWPHGNPQRFTKEAQEVSARLLDLIPGGGTRSQQLRRAIEDAFDAVCFFFSPINVSPRWCGCSCFAMG